MTVKISPLFRESTTRPAGLVMDSLPCSLGCLQPASNNSGEYRMPLSYRRNHSIVTDGHSDRHHLSRTQVRVASSLPFASRRIRRTWTVWQREPPVKVGIVKSATRPFGFSPLLSRPSPLDSIAIPSYKQSIRRGKTQRSPPLQEPTPFCPSDPAAKA